MEFKINIPNNINKVLETLMNNGYEAYVVGGCVRDSILNRVPKDWDVTTNALPEDVIKLFDKTIPTGLKHGTVTVVINNENIEVTTYRIDGDYLDNRKPESVIFTNNLQEDLARRDLTINAMAYNYKNGLIDIFNGLEDINDKVIRFVGNPNLRIEEDALRMLRAIRFSSQLGFKLDFRGYTAIRSNAQSILNISNERIQSELNKILLSDHMNVGLHLLDSTNLLTCILPELIKCKIPQNNPYHIYSVFEHSLCATTCIENELHLKLAALFHDIGKPYCISIDEDGIHHFYGHEHESARIAYDILRSLRYDNKTINHVILLIKFHDVTIGENKKSIKRLLNKLKGDSELFKDLLKLKSADILSQNPKYTKDRLIKLQNVECILNQILTEQQAFTVKDLNISGYDLLEIGFKGKEIGIVLNKLLDRVIEDEELNIHAKLYSLAELDFQMLRKGEKLNEDN